MSDYSDHNPPPFQGPNTGIEGARDAWTTATKIFSDWSHEVVQQFSEGEYVITRVIGRGKHTGDFLGIPASNKDVEMEGIAIHRVVDGKIVEHWGQVDAMGMLMQMGALPPPGGSSRWSMGSPLINARCPHGRRPRCRRPINRCPARSSVRGG